MGGSPTGYYTLIICVLFYVNFFLEVVNSSAAVVVKCYLEYFPFLWVGKTDWRPQISVIWSYDCCEKGAKITRNPVHSYLSPALSSHRRWLRETNPGAAAL